MTPEPVADRPDYFADQQAWREQRAAEPDAARWEALADALEEIGPQPGGVMHPDLIADRLLDHEWFAQTCERKQAEANRVPEPVADDRAHCRTCSCGTGVKDGEATSPTEVSLPWRLMADLLDSRQRVLSQILLARSVIGDAE